jgi:hypothetical protein
MPSALAGLPLTERQQIVVVADDAIPQDRGIRAVQLRSGKLADRVKRNLARNGGAAGPVLDPRVQSARDLRDDGILMLPVRASDALKLGMPIGHPRVGVVYVSDPAEPWRYWPAADFHRRVFEHKFAEAARLVMSLGAETIRVHSKRGWSGELAIGLGFGPLPGVKRQGKAAAHAGRSEDILFEANLQPSQAPALPEGLVWYPQEPSWQMVAAGRLKHGLTDFELKVEWTDDYGVTASFHDKVVRKKVLNFGATSWRISPPFGQLKAHSSPCRLTRHAADGGAPDDGGRHRWVGVPKCTGAVRTPHIAGTPERSSLGPRSYAGRRGVVRAAARSRAHCATTGCAGHGSGASL